jgi:hypothetical protein
MSAPAFAETPIRAAMLKNLQVLVVEDKARAGMLVDAATFGEAAATEAAAQEVPHDAMN